MIYCSQTKTVGNLNQLERHIDAYSSAIPAPTFIPSHICNLAFLSIYIFIYNPSLDIIASSQ